MGFCVTFGALFAKVMRVYRLFTGWIVDDDYSGHHRSSSQGKPHHGDEIHKRRLRVTLIETLVVTGGVLLLDVTVLTTWTVVDPLQWQRNTIVQTQFGESLESEAYCSSDSVLVFATILGGIHLALLGIASYMCYRAKDIPTNFSDGKYVALSIVSKLQILVVGIPILVIVGHDPPTSFFGRSVIIWMNNLVVVLLVFGNLIYQVHFAPIDCKNSGADIGKVLSLYRESGKGKKKKTVNTRKETPANEKQLQQAMMASSSSSSSSSSVSRESISDSSDPSTPAAEQNPIRFPRGIMSSLSFESNVSKKSVSWGVAQAFSETETIEEISIGDIEDHRTLDRFESNSIQGAPQRPQRTARKHSEDNVPRKPRRQDRHSSRHSDSLARDRGRRPSADSLPDIPSRLPSIIEPNDKDEEEDLFYLVGESTTSESSPVSHPRRTSINDPTDEYSEEFQKIPCPICERASSDSSPIPPPRFPSVVEPNDDSLGHW